VIQEASGIVTPVFAERTCRVTRPRNISRGRLTAVDEEIKSIAFGSAFAIRSGGRVLLVTAAHVVRLPAQIESITSGAGTQYDTSDGETKIERGSARIRVGGVSARPVRVLVDEAMDVALIELDPQDLRAIGIEPLKPGTTARDLEVKLWGFPAVARTDRSGKPLPSVPSASQTSQRTDVTDVRATEVICAPLNGVETRGGFSGGPIVDRSGRAVGMIMRSTPETTRCRSIGAIEDLAKTFEARSAPAT
jgi:S1-C subfamily serine protease